MFFLLIYWDLYGNQVQHARASTWVLETISKPLSPWERVPAGRLRMRCKVSAVINPTPALVSRRARGIKPPYRCF